ncbi:hypothetical protein OU787_16925 [Kitasatospora sp. YST-16]|uniref:hypothetical protein n=1 Tax=Kitasatospora sp. YST-16 TaxID=2998080 RepID=UPI0022841BDC|nr:hypothetical protein [Kitasatospora sp. YST-16]WAL73040.1 hypothetical protein OU787_16925 [Kitasatospora sp. YST-16]WNW39091.1 hypothetical protein RKE32_16880 [Streptomyces sp. Li-HN-5-13]
MRAPRETTLWLAWRLVIGRGWRRFTLVALFAVPVLLSAASLQVIGMLNLTGEQKVRSQLGGADLSVTAPGGGQSGPAALPAAPAGAGQVLQGRSSPAFPLVLSGTTQQVGYRETDWSSPLASGLLRTLTGRLPAAADEIVLSRTLAEENHLGPGDTVVFPWAPVSEKDARIVGTVEDPTAYRARFAAGGPGLFARWDDHGHGALLGLATTWLVKTDPATGTELANAARGRRWQVVTRASLSSARTLLDAQPGLLAVPGAAIVLFSAAAAFSLRMRRLNRQLGMLSAVGFSGDRLVRLARTGGAAAVTAGTAAGLVGGVLLGQAARPLVRQAVQRDLGAFSLPFTALGLLALGAVASGVAGIWLPTRAARTSSVRERLTRAPRPAGRSAGRSRRRTVVAVTGALGGLALLFAAAQDAGVVGAVGSVLLVAAALAALPDALHLLARCAARLPLAGRFALRDLDRERRRPVAAIASSALAVVLAVGAATFVASQTERDRTSYVGSRHLDQVEVPLRYTEPSAAVLAAFRGVVGDTVPVEAVQSVVPKGAGPRAEGNRLSVPKAVLRAGPLRPGTVAVVDTEAQFRDLTGRAPTPREWAALTGQRVLVLDPDFPDGFTGATLHGRSRPDDPGPGTPVDTVRSDPVDLTTQSQAVAVTTGAAARAKGFEVFTDGYRATLPATPPADLEQRIGRALEPLGVPTSDLHVERGYRPPLPARWSVMLTIGAAVALLSAMTAVGGAAQELRPRLLLLRVIGFSGGVQRRVLAVQAAVIVGLAMLIGTLGGWLVAGSQLWPQHVPVVLPWPLVLATALGVTALAAAAAAALRPRTGTRLRER